MVTFTKVECLDDTTNYQWHLKCWIVNFILDLLQIVWNRRKWKKNIFHGAELDGEPKCDPNGAFHYPCTVVHHDWIFLLLFIFKPSGNENCFENGLFNPHGAATATILINAVKNDLFCAIIATNTIAGGNIFGNV